MIAISAGFVEIALGVHAEIMIRAPCSRESQRERQLSFHGIAELKYTYLIMENQLYPNAKGFVRPIQMNETLPLINLYYSFFLQLLSIL